MAADVSIPTIITVYFENSGQPHREPVSFAVTCYGYDWPPGPTEERAPGTSTPEPVFSYSATCTRYGCEIDQPYYLNYRHIDYCDLSGETAGQAFGISKYASLPIDFPTCEMSGGTRRCGLRVDLVAGTVTSLSQIDQPLSQIGETRPSGGPSVEGRFLLALLATLVVELAVLWLLVRFVFRQPRVDTGRLLFVGALASMLTLPYLWFVLPPFLDASYAVYVGELLPTYLERALALSLVANAASFIVGRLLF